MNQIEEKPKKEKLSIKFHGAAQLRRQTKREMPLRFVEGAKTKNIVLAPGISKILANTKFMFFATLVEV